MRKGSEVLRQSRRVGAAATASVALLVVAGCGNSSSTSRSSTTATSAASQYPVAKLQAKLLSLMSKASQPAGVQGTPSVPGSVAGVPPAPGTPSIPTTPGPTGGTPTISSVTCPSIIKPAAGRSVRCIVSGTKGLTGRVTVTFDNASGTSFHYKAAMKAPASHFTQTITGPGTLG